MTEPEYREYEALYREGALSQEEFERQTAGYISPEQDFRRRAPYAAAAGVLTLVLALLLPPDFDRACAALPYDDHPQGLVIACWRLFHWTVMPVCGVIALLLLPAARLHLRKQRGKQMRGALTASLILGGLSILLSLMQRIQMLLPQA